MEVNHPSDDPGDNLTNHSAEDCDGVIEQVLQIVTDQEQETATREIEQIYETDKSFKKHLDEALHYISWQKYVDMLYAQMDEEYSMKILQGETLLNYLGVLIHIFKIHFLYKC